MSFRAFALGALLAVCYSVSLVMGAPSCAKAPATLSPAGIRDFRANEAVVALGSAQHVAIQLNGVQVCEPLPCRPLLSDGNTRIVVDAVAAALTTIRSTPAGWRATANTALDQINGQLDAFGRGKLRAYIDAARLVINAIAN